MVQYVRDLLYLGYDGSIPAFVTHFLFGLSKGKDEKEEKQCLF
jgi:hypothetical protein